MKKIISLLHSNIPFIVSTIVIFIILEMLFHEGWTPIVWFLIITLLVLELYFSSVVRNMLNMQSKYQFVQFISHLSSFTFLSIFLFGFMYSEFSTTVTRRFIIHCQHRNLNRKRKYLDERLTCSVL